jgi:hypothetical protein
VLQAPDGRKAVLATSDLIGLSRSIYDRVSAQLQSKYGLDRSQLLLTSSHTHCGPVLRDSLEDLYPIDETQRRLINAYATSLEQTIVDKVGEALSALQPATITASDGICRFAVNRRNNAEPKVPELMDAGALKGPVDHAVPVLCVRDASGKPTAIVFGYACHNTTLDFYQWCGDYAGFAQIDLEKRYPGCQAMFFSGCGGDQNPLPRRTVERCQRYGKELADAVAAVVSKESAPLAPRLETAYSGITLRLDPPAARKDIEAAAVRKDYQGRWAHRLLRQMDQGKPFDLEIPYPVVVWRLGGRQWWIGLGGEVVVDFALRLKKEIGPSIWVSAYANDVMAYIPSKRVREEGGYEGSTSMIGYGMPSARWASDVEERVVGAVVTLIRTIDPSAPISPGSAAP